MSLSDAKVSASKHFPSQVSHHLIKKGSTKAGQMKQNTFVNVKKKSSRAHAHPRRKRTKLRKSHKNQVSKKTLIERNQLTDAYRRRIQVLDGYFVHPQNIEEPSLSERNFPRSKEWLQSALSLDELHHEGSNSEMHFQKAGSEFLTTQNRQMPSHFLDWSRKGFRNGEVMSVENQSQRLYEAQGPLSSETYDENSEEGQNIVNVASIAQRSNESQAIASIKSLNYQREKVSNGVFQNFPSTSSAFGSKQSYRYKFISSLIKPQLAGILADLKYLDARRHRVNPVDLKALNSDFRSHELTTEKEIKENKVGEYLNERENANDMQKERQKTTKKSEPQYHANDMFILGAPNRSTYLHDLFLANPMPINHSSGSEFVLGKYKEHGHLRPTMRWKKLQTSLKFKNQFRNLHVSGYQEHVHNQTSKKVGAPPHVHRFKETATENHSGSFNKGFDRFRGSGFQEPVYSAGSWKSKRNGSKSDTRVGTPPIHETVRKLKPTSRVTLQSLKDKSMPQTAEKSNEDGSSIINLSGEMNSSSTQEIRPLSYFRPTAGQAFPKVTTVSSYRRTTISNEESGSNSDVESWTVGSGEGSVYSGSGEDEAFLNKFYNHYKPEPTVRPLSSTWKTLTGNH